MNYLVLGGNGFIGSYIVSDLLERGYKVRVFDRSPEKFREPLYNVEYVYGDLMDIVSIDKALEGIDVLIHSISTTVPFTSNQDIKFDIESNLISSVDIFQLAIKKGVKRLVYLSSGGAIYGNPVCLPISEEHPTNPISSYGITKLAIEKYLQFLAINSSVAFNIIRPSNPYGPRQNPFNNQGVIPVFLEKISRGQTLEVWGDPEISKDYIYVSDLSKAICDISEHGRFSQIYNVGSGTMTSINEIIEVIREVTSKAVNVNYSIGNNFDVSRVCLDIKKVKSHIGYRPEVNLLDGIRKTWAFINELS